MKNKLLLPILFISFFTVGQTSSGNSQVTFGRYSNCTSGRGLCSFSVSKTENEMLSVFKTHKISENIVVLEVRKSSITIENQIKIAGKPFSDLKENEELFFIQTENFIIDETTLLNLGIERKYNKINPGNYQMIAAKDKITITFSLKM